MTAGVVLSRLGMPPDVRFFSPAEEAIATALCDQLLDQAEDARLPVVNQIDARLAEKETDGWHYEGMPEDGKAWRLSLAALMRTRSRSIAAGLPQARCTIRQSWCRRIRSGLW